MYMRIGVALLGAVVLAGGARAQTITANPNPAPVDPGSGLATARVTWAAPAGAWGLVTVEIRGETGPQLMAWASQGSADAPWIAPGKEYVFRLWTTRGWSGWTPVAEVSVRAALPALPGGLPDVVVDELAQEPAPVGPGRPVRLRARVRNQGSLATPDLVGVAFHVDGVKVGWGIAPPLAPGEVADVWLAQTFLAPAEGTHLLHAVADDVNRFAEADEGNNVRAGALEVRRVPVRYERAGTQILRDGVPLRAVGMNCMDLGLHAQGLGSAGGDPGLGAALARRQLQDLRDYGLPLVRFSVWGWSSQDLASYRDDPARFLDRLDAVGREAEEAQVLLVPVLMWRADAVNELCGESRGALLRDPASRSWALLRRLVEDVVVRLRGRDSVLMWELTNELNLDADLDPGQRGGSSLDRFSTDDMAAFVRRLAEEVRRFDPLRPISSGYSDPRPSAWHLRHQPEWAPGGADWREDSLGELESWLALAHPDPVDVISVHFYDAGPGSNERLGHTGKLSTGALRDYWSAAQRLGKPLFVGELGDYQPFLSDVPDAPFARAVLAEVEALGIPLAAAWNWQFFQFSLAQADAFSFLAGRHDPVLALFRAQNERAGLVGPRQSGAFPPRGLIVAPRAGQTVPGFSPVEVVAQAGDADGVREVRLWVDGVLVAAVGGSGEPVHRLSWMSGAPGRRRLELEVIDGSGAAARHALEVEVR